MMMTLGLLSWQAASVSPRRAARIACFIAWSPSLRPPLRRPLPKNGKEVRVTEIDRARRGICNSDADRVCGRDVTRHLQALEVALRNDLDKVACRGTRDRDGRPEHGRSASRDARKVDVSRPLLIDAIFAERHPRSWRASIYADKPHHSLAGKAVIRPRIQIDSNVASRPFPIRGCIGTGRRYAPPPAVVS